MRSSPTTLSVDQCTILMRLPEAFRENETLHTTGFHSSYSSPNLWSHWKWIEWNLACSGEGVGGCLTECSVVYNHQGDLLGREETREWGLDVIAFVSDG